jgi:hypothetical protein
LPLVLPPGCRVLVLSPGLLQELLLVLVVLVVWVLLVMLPLVLQPGRRVLAPLA